MGEEKKQSDKLVITELESGAAEELPPHDRVRLTIAVNVLRFVALIVSLTFILLVWGPENRVDQVKSIFEFVKTIAPPMVTLVIGFYFRNEGA